MACCISWMEASATSKGWEGGGVVEPEQALVARRAARARDALWPMRGLATGRVEGVLETRLGMATLRVLRSWADGAGRGRWQDVARSAAGPARPVPHPPRPWGPSRLPEPERGRMEGRGRPPDPVADAIVLRVGPETSPGLRWEIEDITTQEDPTRVVLALPSKPGPAGTRMPSVTIWPSRRRRIVAQTRPSSRRPDRPEARSHHCPAWPSRSMDPGRPSSHRRSLRHHLPILPRRWIEGNAAALTRYGRSA